MIIYVLMTFILMPQNR